MKILDGQVVYSPSDLVRFLASPYACWMDRLVLERPGAATPDADGAEMEMLTRRGHEHEAAVLERLRAEGRSVRTIEREGDPCASTIEALGSGADVIYQGALTDGLFAGYFDFLVREAEGWEVWDAKLSRSVKPSHVLQLCCYADLLARGAGVPAQSIAIVLGSGEVVRLRAADFHWYYLSVREAFLELMERFDPDLPPPDPEPNADHGRWATAASRWFEERDHLIRVAGIRRSQVQRNRSAIRTPQGS